MKVLKKLRFYQAKCHFCQGIGNVVSARAHDIGQDIAVCDDCARKLVTGIATAMEEMKRQHEKMKSEAQVVEAKETPVETTPNGLSVTPTDGNREDRLAVTAGEVSAEVPLKS